jgi:hypothetical protein
VLLIMEHEGRGLRTLTKRDQLFPSQNNILQRSRRSKPARDLHSGVIVAAVDRFPYRNALQRVGTGMGACRMRHAPVYAGRSNMPIGILPGLF